MSNSYFKWSALIYGRTYEVDFRLIAMPKYFDTLYRSWAENHILATTQIPEKLSGNPRWSLFTNENYCVFATTCMVRELFPNDISLERQDITRDFRGRPLYAFIGYVAKRDESGKFPTLPAHSDLKLEQFQPLYQKYVQQCWDVKPYQPQSKQPILNLEEEEVRFNLTEISDSGFKLNQDRKIIKLWSEEYQLDVWNTVIREIEISRQPISVCLGLSTPRDAENSPFFNATVLRLDTSRDGLDFQRDIEQPSQQTKQTISVQKNQYEQISQSSESSQYLDKSTCNIPQTSNLDFSTQKGSGSLNDRQKDREHTEGISRKVDAFFNKNERDNSEAFGQVSTPKFKDVIKIVWNSLSSRYPIPLNNFPESESKQLSYEVQNLNEDINKLAEIAGIDSTTLRKHLAVAINNISCDDLVNIVDERLNLVSTYKSKIDINEPQQDISRKLEGFEVKANDKKDNDSLNNNENSSTSKAEDSQKQTQDWF